MEAAFHLSSQTGAKWEREQPKSLLSATMLNGFSAMPTSILLDFRYSLKPCRIYSMGKKHLVIFNDWQVEKVSASVSVSTPAMVRLVHPFQQRGRTLCVLRQGPPNCLPGAGLQRPLLFLKGLAQILLSNACDVTKRNYLLFLTTNCPAHTQF